MSDLLQAASEALGTPPELVSRSAAARAAANDTTVEDVLASWSGGAPVATATAPPATETADEATEPEPEPTAEETQAEAPARVAMIEQLVPEVDLEPDSEPLEPEPVLEPVPLRTRLKTAIRVGAWTGAALGVVGFLAASAFWASNTTLLPDSGPVVVVSPTSLVIGIALVSLVFGAVVSGLSRAATAWTDPAMQLSSSKQATVWVGAGLGVVLGLVAGAVLAGLGTPVEASEPPMVQLPILATLFVMILGGALLGAGTAGVPQLLGVPVVIAEEQEELDVIKSRLSNAMGIPMAGMLLLLVLVLPFAYALIESNHLAPGVGGAAVAIIAASGILGFAALAGSKPEMRISMGDILVAIIGIGVVLVILISVLFYVGGDEGHGEDGAEAVRITQLG